MALTSSASSSSKRMDISFGSNDSFSRNKSKCYKKNSKDSYTWLFFDLFEYENDDKIVTKVRCSIKGCKISDEFMIYDSTLNMIKIGEYKTASNIVSTIEPVLEEFGITLKRLTKLERSIRWLVNDLENSTNIEHQHDGTTEFLSDSNYATLSIMVPTREELIHHLNNMNSESGIINE
ncbi:5679_t:CDS:2, partial [Racocetra persica]